MINISASDVMALISLLGSGFAIWYGYKAYRAQYLPSIDIDWELEQYVERIDPDGPLVLVATRIGISLTNLSSTVALHKVMARIDLLARDSSNMREPGIANYLEYNPKILQPGDPAVRRAPASKLTLESLITEHLPGVLELKKTGETGPSRIVTMTDPATNQPYQGEATYYAVITPRPIMLRLTVTYRPGLADAKTRTIIEIMCLTPNDKEIEGRGKTLQSWNYKLL